MNFVSREKSGITGLAEGCEIILTRNFIACSKAQVTQLFSFNRRSTA
jgi:hypothetical protein